MSPKQKLELANDLSTKLFKEQARSGLTEKEFLRIPKNSKRLKQIRIIRGYADLELNGVI